MTESWHLSLDQSYQLEKIFLQWVHSRTISPNYLAQGVANLKLLSSLEDISMKIDVSLLKVWESLCLEQELR